jgi:hypothetical protein
VGTAEPGHRIHCSSHVASRGFREIELTGVAFHYDRPDAKAPHSVLSAIPPALDRAGLRRVQVLRETLELAKRRVIDLDDLRRLDDLGPAIRISSNGDTGQAPSKWRHTARTLIPRGRSGWSPGTWPLDAQVEDEPMPVDERRRAEGGAALLRMFDDRPAYRRYGGTSATQLPTYGRRPWCRTYWLARVPQAVRTAVGLAELTRPGLDSRPDRARVLGTRGGAARWGQCHLEAGAGALIRKQVGQLGRQGEGSWCRGEFQPPRVRCGSALPNRGSDEESRVMDAHAHRSARIFAVSVCQRRFQNADCGHRASSL